MEVNCLNDSIFALLDYSWYAHPILSQSGVSSTVSVSGSSSAAVESDTVSRSTEGDIENCRRPFWSAGEQCSTSQSFINRYNFGGERRCSSNDSEMRVVFDAFDSNGDGLISQEELRRFMSCCGKDASDVEVHSLIASVDENRDGGVDFQEFLSLFQSHHSDGDVTSEFGERGAREDDSDEDLLEAFRVFDRNQDGFISAQELQAVLLNLGIAEGRSLFRCQKMIRNVDRDGDGKCNILEFQEMMSRPVWCN